jgi:mannose-1-phosphate guanylyltransferase/mannose-6-phosphate isomerase
MATHDIPVFPVLLAGGTGSRLWPVSRTLYPKQLMRLTGKQSLIQRTIQRILPAVPSTFLRIVCGADHAHAMARHMIGIAIDPQDKIITEPCGRNTAPAILLATLMVLKEQPDALLGVFPADHIIDDDTSFQKRFQEALALAQAGHIVTFGIKPHYPETGYGYIEGADRLPHGAMRIRQFVEKPNRETAQAYLQAGNYFWNSGMFTFRASTILAEFKRLQPAMVEQLSQMLTAGENLTTENYGRLEDISIDYAIMENTDKGAVLPSDFGWSDIGSWKSLYDFLPQDDHHNVIDGDVITQDTNHCFIMGSGRLIAANRLENIVIVETPDAVFVSDIESSRNVKQIVNQLKDEGRRESHRHTTVHHAWGRQTLVDAFGDVRVTRLKIYPGAEVQIEAGQWTTLNFSVVGGQASVRLSERHEDLAIGQCLVVDPGENVFFTNPGDQMLLVVQIETHA